MRAQIGSSLLASVLAQPRQRPFEIGDTRLAGFTLRIQPSGVRSYYARFGRNRRIALGKVGAISPDEARDQCQRILGNIASGRHPKEGLAGSAGVILGRFLVETFEPWARANRPRTVRNTLEKLRLQFKPWLAEPLSAITVERLEFWKARRLRSGIKPTTVLRDLFALSSVLTRAVRTGRLAANPIRFVEKPRFDRRPRVRFLSVEEEARLRTVLADRDQQLIAARVSGNERLARRGESPLPPLPHFGDHLTPAILLSMNTGLRMGEIRRLRWDWVELNRRWLTVDGAYAKTRQTRHVPLNVEACRVLTQWREQCEPGKQLFPIVTCFKTAWTHVLHRAGIVEFRWHDLRHHFASRLVQAGVPLNTVRDLLGHVNASPTAAVGAESCASIFTGNNLTVGLRTRRVRSANKPCPCNRRQVKIRLAFTPCRRATSAPEQPDSSISCTMRRFSATLRNRRGTILRPRVSVERDACATAVDVSICTPGGHVHSCPLHLYRYSRCQHVNAMCPDRTLKHFCADWAPITTRCGPVRVARRGRRWDEIRRLIAVHQGCDPAPNQRWAAGQSWMPNV